MELYKMALLKSEETSKPLIVIGDPCNGVFNKVITTYKHGNICLDISGCQKCKSYDINKTMFSEFKTNCKQYKSNLLIIGTDEET